MSPRGASRNPADGTCRYAAYYLTRNSLSYTAPEMIKDPALNFDMTKVGGLVSIMPVAYACSKFISGVVGARTSPVLLLAGAAPVAGTVQLHGTAAALKAAAPCVRQSARLVAGMAR